MKINVVGMDYSGQALDAELLRLELVRHGHKVTITPVLTMSLFQRILVKTGLHKLRLAKYDLNIFIQQPRAWWMPVARRSVLIPNPDWIDDSELKGVKKMNAIWCKTRHALKIFDQMGCSSHFLGFTSPVAVQEESSLQRNPWGCLHIGGSSNLKGTKVLIDQWKKNPQWPILTILSQIETHKNAVAGVANITLISEKLPANEVTNLRANNGIHIQMSETEGYGHVISESMASGAVVVTLEAEPMNELINSSNGFLVQAHLIGKHYLAECFSPLSPSFQKIMEEVFSSSRELLSEKSQKAKQDFFLNRKSFEGNLRLLLSRLS